jgi:hypothetical protein
MIRESSSEYSFQGSFASGSVARRGKERIDLGVGLPRVMSGWRPGRLGRRCGVRWCRILVCFRVFEARTIEQKTTRIASITMKTTWIEPPTLPCLFILLLIDILKYDGWQAVCLL